MMKSVERRRRCQRAFGDGSTILMGAAQAGQTDTVRVLLTSGASVNAQTRDGMTALLVAAKPVTPRLFAPC